MSYDPTDATAFDELRVAGWYREVEDSLRTDLAVAIDTLIATVAALNAITALTNAEINANPAAVIKDVAREVKTVARQVTRIARLVGGEFSSGDCGDE